MKKSVITFVLSLSILVSNSLIYGQSNENIINYKDNEVSVTITFPKNKSDIDGVSVFIDREKIVFKWMPLKIILDVFSGESILDKSEVNNISTTINTEFPYDVYYNFRDKYYGLDGIMFIEANNRGELSKDEFLQKTEKLILDELGITKRIIAYPVYEYGLDLRTIYQNSDNLIERTLKEDLPKIIKETDAIVQFSNLHVFEIIDWIEGYYNVVIAPSTINLNPELPYFTELPDVKVYKSVILPKTSIDDTWIELIEKYGINMVKSTDQKDVLEYSLN